MPGTDRPYSTYSIQITAPNFEPVEISGAEILSGQTALQNTTLIPKPNTPEANEELFVIPPHTLYEKYPPKIPEEEIKTIEETGEIVPRWCSNNMQYSYGSKHLVPSLLTIYLLSDPAVFLKFRCDDISPVSLCDPH